MNPTAVVQEGPGVSSADVVLKRCNKCKRDLPKTQKHFFISNGYLSSPCKDCWYKTALAWRARNKDKVRAIRTRSNIKHRAYKNHHQRCANRKLRAEVLAAYGGVCTCCGESVAAFLSIDHVDNNGSKHRKEIGSVGGHTFYQWLRKNNYPKEGFQILCMNCNHAKGKYGFCPHERVPDDECAA